MKRNIKLNATRFFVGALMVAATVTSCTDLEIEETDSVITDASFAGVSDPESFLGNMFNTLNGQIGDQANIFALQEVTTDAALIPTRGSDWGDNGIWRQLHQHNWLTSHQYIQTAFLQWNTTHFQAAQILSDLTTTASEADRANAYFLRALGMWVVLDNWGQVPVRDPEAPLFDDPIVISGAEAVDQIVSDLNEAIAKLPAGAPQTNNGRPNKAAARHLLAKVILNKHIYLGTAPDNGDMSQVISLVDQINGEGYDLQEGYFDIFRESGDNETIWFISAGVSNRIWNGLHYAQTSFRDNEGGGWNGFATLSSYYDLFEGDSEINVEGSGQEERRGVVPTIGMAIEDCEGCTDNNEDGFADATQIGLGFLIGQQYAIDGTPLQDRAGAPLTFKRDFRDGNGDVSLINNDETTGIRVQKYAARYGSFNTHEIYFRYADAHLMKAEAIFRSGGDAAPLVNELRVLRGATPFGSVGAQELIDERGRELYAELWRRNDLIRFGQFTDAYELKPEGDDSRNLFPIPASQVILNPNLVQNPGY